MLSGKCGMFRACGCRAFSNGMGKPTLHSWRPVLVHRRTPLWYFDLCTAQGRNLQCGATRPLCRECCVQSSLPCVGLANRRSADCSLAGEWAVSLLETLPAKEAMKWFDCSGNHLGCRNWADKGLQCGLSGNRVPQWATLWQHAERETT